MSRLLRASTLIGQPVVTLTGESPFEVKDVVFDTAAGKVLGFNLRKHGFLGSPAKEHLAWEDVHGLGPDAVVIGDASVLNPGKELSSSGGDVMSDRVITESGVDLGKVVEVILQSGSRADVVGFEIEASGDGGGPDGHHVFIPLPDTMGISGEKVIVPDSATDYISEDLSGFGSAVEDFRSKLTEGNT